MNTNYLAAGIEIVGSIKFSSDMVIDGKIEGQITSDNGAITIGEHAIITGDITAQSVTICGTVEGKIQSTRCELKGTSSLTGDITTKNLAMEEGARLNGQAIVG